MIFRRIKARNDWQEHDPWNRRGRRLARAVVIVLAAASAAVAMGLPAIFLHDVSPRFLAGEFILGAAMCWYMLRGL